MVAKPSPPEICWHLMAGFGCPSTRGCIVVEFGHCTRKLAAPAFAAARDSSKAGSRHLEGEMFNMACAPFHERADTLHGLAQKQLFRCRWHARGIRSAVVRGCAAAPGGPFAASLSKPASA